MTGKGKVRTLLAQSQGYAFLGFDVKDASTKEYSAFKEIYTHGVKDFIDQNLEIFARNDITFFGKGLGGLMATLARTEIHRSNMTPNKSRVLAFMEDEKNLEALKPNFILGEGREEGGDREEDSLNLCQSTRIYGRPRFRQGKMRKAFKNPCSEYEGIFQVKRRISKTLFVAALVGSVAISAALIAALIAVCPVACIFLLFLEGSGTSNNTPKETEKKEQDSECRPVSAR